MCKKTFKIFIISALLILCMPIFACAAPTDEKEEEKTFFEFFNLDEEEFIFEETENDTHPMTNLFIEMDKDVIQDNEDENSSNIQESDLNIINSFSFLHLNKGFDAKDRIDNTVSLKNQFISVSPTFSSSKKISGTGEEGIAVGVIVYDGLDEEGNINITYQAIKTIGLSKIFNETIELNTVGTNYISIAVMKDGITEYKKYILNRKEEETRKKLENLLVNFGETDIDNEELTDIEQDEVVIEIEEKDETKNLFEEHTFKIHKE